MQDGETAAVSGLLNLKRFPIEENNYELQKNTGLPGMIKDGFLRVAVIPLCLIAFALVPAAFAHGNHAIERIIEKQKSIKTISAQFTQEKHSTMLKDPLISKGSFFYKSPDKVAWIYNGQLQIVSDGKDITVFYPQLKEAEIIPLNKSIIRLPLNFNLAGLRQYFRIDLAEKKNRYVVTLTPISKTSMFSKMVIILLRSGVPEIVKMFEKTGDRSIIRFKKRKINIKLPENIFNIKLPRGTAIKRFRQ
ncbi:outer-membrane lipoprotein carrier protein precursor [bacterium BMS3Abin07]|nr:outer-membrane lipoprotein carrier protein precursor [bacterium BMS3Abin07]GBE32766.1 outer-membrane lipoprotein carrier protein precursor [bacterium BMS3Bbin05]